MMKKTIIFLVLTLCFLAGNSQGTIVKKVGQEKMLERFLSYVKIVSQSIEDPDIEFPMTEGQKEIAQLIYDEAKSLGGKGVKVTLSDDYYLYIDIPSNIKKSVPSVLFMAHLDVTPDVPFEGSKPVPMVHRNYDGGDLKLPGGITLSPDVPQCSHLKDLAGKTIVTSDGTTLLGADDKTGCAVLISMLEEIINNPKFKHGRVMICLSQNEDIGKAAKRYDPKVFGDRPDVVIDVDGGNYDEISVANFSAIGQTYHFKGNIVHPGYAKERKYADALTATAYFIGLIPPELHPSMREGEEGYIHCNSVKQRVDANNKPLPEYYAMVRLRYFDQNEGAYQKKLMEDNLLKTRQAFPLVECTKIYDELQYENVAYTMPEYLPELIAKAASSSGLKMNAQAKRAGTTASMLVAEFPEALPGGVAVYSGQNSIHSVYEWCCIEELLDLVVFTENIITELVNRK